VPAVSAGARMHSDRLRQCQLLDVYARLQRPNVGVIYRANCYNLFYEPIACRAGFDGKDKVSVSWAGTTGPPAFYSDGQEGSPTVCTGNNTGEETCKVFTLTQSVPQCGVSHTPTYPAPRCGQGETYCTKYSPPRCVPTSNCKFAPAPP
jgi:hypothetical protein